MNPIGYDEIAAIYDYYVTARYDFRFFLSRIEPGTHVLELTSGTGRLSIPLIEAGAVLTGVDLSQEMLNIFEQKLARHGLEARTICTDVEDLAFDDAFELAIFPFQSFMELVGKEKQLSTLRSVQGALVPGGRFFCTMHNPILRSKSVDGILRGVGPFPCPQGTIVVSGFEAGGRPVVCRTQFIEIYNEADILIQKQLQRIEFELIEEDQFRMMAEETGFSVKAVYGDYDANYFDRNESPFMIWELEKAGN